MDDFFYLEKDVQFFYKKKEGKENYIRGWFRN